MTRIRPIILAIAIAASLSAPAVAQAAAGIARVPGSKAVGSWRRRSARSRNIGWRRAARR